ncbi:hypothetical protein SAMN05444161_1536 [Rhizobiales bacterium GAS191]|nr:hypothetical protein SAMN05444161_1536 [Rhizobiales bacterium GAS191]
MSPVSRVLWLKTTVIVAFCIGLLMSWHLWVGPRSYPKTPVSSLLPQLDAFVAHGLFAALFALAAAILMSSKPQTFIAAFLAIIVAFGLLDQARWQPWVFQYSFLLATLALFSWNSDDIGGQKRVLNITRLIIASTYIFSGLQKLNLNFIAMPISRDNYRPEVARRDVPAHFVARPLYDPMGMRIRG